MLEEVKCRGSGRDWWGMRHRDSRHTAGTGFDSRYVADSVLGFYNINVGSEAHGGAWDCQDK